MKFLFLSFFFLSPSVSGFGTKRQTSFPKWLGWQRQYQKKSCLPPNVCHRIHCHSYNSTCLLQLSPLCYCFSHRYDKELSPPFSALFLMLMGICLLTEWILLCITEKTSSYHSRYYHNTTHGRIFHPRHAISRELSPQ